MDKKSKKVSIPVSKTNYNRVKFGTHTLQKVLHLEGYLSKHYKLIQHGDGSCSSLPFYSNTVQTSEGEFHISEVQLEARPRMRKVAMKLEESPQP